MLYNHSIQTGKAPASFFVRDEVKLPLTSRDVWKEATGRFKPYQEGELVVYKLLAYARTGKLTKRYEGPCRVSHADKKGLTYEIQDSRGNQNRKAHSKQLKKWYGRAELPKSRAMKDGHEAPKLVDPPVLAVEDQLKG